MNATRVVVVRERYGDDATAGHSREPDARADIGELVADLEWILNEADRGLTRLQLGEAQRGTATLAKIKDRARDAIRHAEGPDGESWQPGFRCRGGTSAA